MTLIVQIIIAAVTFAMMMLKKHFLNKKVQESQIPDNQRDEEKIKKYNLLTKMFLIMSIVGMMYFTLYLITTTPFTFWNTIFALLKMLVFTICCLMIIFYDNEKFEILDEDDIDNAIKLIAFILVIVFVNNIIQDNKYEKNIVENKEIQYIKKEYKLSREFNAIDLEENEIVENSISEYFDYEITRYNSGNVSREYSICYIDEKGDMIFKELKDDNTKLVPLKKDETPYLEIKTYTKYGMDNNKNPPKQIIISEKTQYVIHVLQEDIDKVLKLEKEE